MSNRENTSRTYNDANHNEFNRSIIHGSVTFNYNGQAIPVNLLELSPQDDGHAEGKTPLIISAQKGLTAATRLLLDQNVDKDAKDNSGRTALHYAAENCDEGIVRLLVEHGAKRNISDNVRKIALELAMDNMYVPPLPVANMRD